MTRLSLYLLVSVCVWSGQQMKKAKGVFVKLTDVHKVAFIINTSGVSCGESLCYSSSLCT